jgi:hypothetical protein
MNLFIDSEKTDLPKRRYAPYLDVDNCPRLFQSKWVLGNPVGRENSRMEYIIKLAVSNAKGLSTYNL